VIVFGKNLIKFIFGLCYFFFLSSSKTKHDDIRKFEQPRFETIGFNAVLLGFLFYDLYTIIYVIMRMIKVGRGCFNKNPTSGRNLNYRTKRLEYKFKWFEFLGPLASISSHVSLNFNFE
jgi:hypothetical protein